MSSNQLQRALSFPRAVGLLVLSASSALVTDSCKDATEIVLSLSTDAKCSGDAEAADHLVGVAIVAGRPKKLGTSPAGETTACKATAPLNAIGTLVLVPQSSGNEGVELLVAAGVENIHGARLSSDDCLAKVQSAEGMKPGDPCIIARRRLGFIDGSRLDLPIELNTQCTGVVCNADSTCFKGGCTSSTATCDRATGKCDLGSGGTGGAGGAGGGTSTTVTASMGSTDVSSGSTVDTSSVSTTATGMGGAGGVGGMGVTVSSVSASSVSASSVSVSSVSSTTIASSSASSSTGGPSCDQGMCTAMCNGVCVQGFCSCTASSNSSTASSASGGTGQGGGGAAPPTSSSSGTGAMMSGGGCNPTSSSSGCF